MKKVLTLILMLCLVLTSCATNDNVITQSTPSTSSEDTLQNSYGELLSLNKAARVSSTADMMYPQSITDGDPSTVWSCGPCKPQLNAWIKIDLTQNCNISHIKFNWGNSAPTNYKVELSRGDYEYTTVFESQNKDTETTLQTPVTARYVKISLLGADPSTCELMGITVKEIEVYGNVSEDKTMGNEKVWDSGFELDTAKQKAAQEKYNAMQKLEVTRVANDKYDYLGVNKDRISYLKQNAFDGFDFYQLGDENGLIISDITIDAGLGKDSVTIVQLSDLHFAGINEKDIAENNPTVIATAEKRKGFESKLPNVKASLEYSEIADRVVVTGDVLDYLSHGTVEMMNEVMWKKYPYTIAIPGNHEYIQYMSNVPETLTMTERMSWVTSEWKHDYEYVSTMVGEKVMVIAMDNGRQTDGMYSFQYGTAQALKTDLEKAKQNGYTVLLFTHVPLYTQNPADTDVLSHYLGDWANRNDEGQKRYIWNFSTNHATATGVNSSDKDSRPFCGFPEMQEDTENAKVFKLINEYSSVIKGVFTGHKHACYYTEILCDDGTLIPQYTMNGSSYTFGNATKITVK